MGEAKNVPVVLVVAGGGDVEGSVTELAAGKHAVPLVGNRVVTEGVEVLGAVKQNIHQTFQAFGRNHDRPGELFTLAVHLAAKNSFAEMANNLVVAVESVEGALEGVGEQQAANEIANGDLAILQLGLKVDVPIGFEGVEEDLPVGGLHDGVEIVAIVCDFQGVSPGSLVGADTKVRNT